MANDRRSSEPSDSFRGLSEKEIYDFGRAISRDPRCTTILLAGLSCNTLQQPISIPVLGTGFPNPPISTATDSEREGVRKNIADLLAKYHEKFRIVEQSSSRDVTIQDWPSRPMAVAWKLGVGFEAILHKNPREVVPSEEVMVGSLLRGVVKITVSFRASYVTGSGVLLDDWTVATVGHLLVNDRGHAEGVAIQAGRGGSDNTIETRDGIYVAVHNKWYEERSDSNDLAFIRLSKPFNTVNPIKYMQTPVTHDGTDAAIYGYPFDMPDHDDARGERLCVSKSLVRYSQSNSTGLLEHEGDTEKGTSGGPVLDASGIVIALHRGWAPDGSDVGVNQAVTIDRNGNDFWAFRLILGYMSQREDDRVKLLGEVKEVGGFAFSWLRGLP